MDTCSIISVPNIHTFDGDDRELVKDQQGLDISSIKGTEEPKAFGGDDVNTTLRYGINTPWSTSPTTQVNFQICQGMTNNNNIKGH